MKNLKVTKVTNVTEVRKNRSHVTSSNDETKKEGKNTNIISDSGTHNKLIDLWMKSERERTYKEVCPLCVSWLRKLLPENHNCNEDCNSCWDMYVDSTGER